MQKNILIVDDDKKYRFILRRKLEITGYKVYECTNGEEAFEFLQSHTASIDLVLLDLIMPGVDGVEFMDKMQKSKLTTPPVIVLTNQTEGSFPSQITEYIVKTNISLDALVEKIRKILAE